jgi:pSer/pThr/pTyr-binding forkhead associated (FHA) protein
VSEPLLTILKLCLLALLYLFFFRVLRAVWVETRPPEGAAGFAPEPSSRRKKRAKSAPRSTRGGARRGPPTRLLVVEPDDQKGRTYEIGDELTLGRAAGCQITLDDNFVSQLHAKVYPRDGRFIVEDLGSTNGTYLNRARVTGAMVMQPGDHLKVGNTVMELA